MIAPVASVPRPRVHDRLGFPLGTLGFGIFDHRDGGVTFSLWPGSAWDGRALFCGHIECGMAAQARAIADAMDARRLVDVAAPVAVRRLPMSHVEVLLWPSEFGLRALYGPDSRPVLARAMNTSKAARDLRRIAGVLGRYEAQIFGGGL